MRKIGNFIVVVLMISLALVGCSGGDQESEKTDGNAPAYETTLKETKKSDNDNSKNGGNMEIPKEYPKDSVPLLDDAKISHVIKNDTNKGINITYSTGKSLEDAVKFYKEVMKEGKNTQEFQSEGSHILTGTIGNYSVAITIMVVQSEVTVNIDTRPEK